MLCAVSYALATQRRFLRCDDVVKRVLLDAVADGVKPEVALFRGTGTHSKKLSLQHLVKMLCQYVINNAMTLSVI